jgi:hypothetical protein
MSYVIKRCEKCGKTYNVHDNGKITGACKHIDTSKSRGRKLFKATMANTLELDKMIEEEQAMSRRKKSKYIKPRSG